VSTEQKSEPAPVNTGDDLAKALAAALESRATAIGGSGNQAINDR
jgi:hypothetical protein